MRGYAGKMDGYGADLAYIHDVGFELIAHNAIPVVLDELTGPAEGPVVELGCGGGVIAEALVAAGYTYTGYDLSPAMVEIARERVRGASFEVASLVDVALPRCQAILAVGEVLGYAIDPRNRHEELEQTIERCGEALGPGGVLIFDLAGPGRGGPEGTTRNFAVGSDWAVTVAATAKGNPPTLHREITAFRRLEGGLYRRSFEAHELSLHDPGDVADALDRKDFALERRPGYGNEALPGHAVFIARKR